MIDLRDPPQPEDLRLERIEVREKIAAAYVRGKQAGQLISDQRCRRARITALLGGFVLGAFVVVLAIHFGVQVP